METPLFDEQINLVRRVKNAVNDEAWIKSFLIRGRYGVLATEDAHQPFAYGRLYAYTEDGAPGTLGAVYLHGAKQGRTRTNVDANPRVCFSVSAMGDLMTEDSAVKLDVEYASVVLFGCMLVVEAEDEARRGLHLLMRKYYPQLEPGRDIKDVQPVDLHRTSVYRLDIYRWSAKTNTQKDLLSLSCP